MKKFILIIGLLASLFVPEVSFAGIVETPFNGEDVNLYMFEDDASGYQLNDPGVREINNALFAIITWFKYVLGAIATVWTVWQGYRMLSSGGDESQFDSAKNSIMWGIIGLVLSFVAEPFVRTVLYGGSALLEPGQAILDPEVSTGAGIAELQGIMNWLKTLLGIIAVAMIIFTGIRAMLALSSDDQMDKQKTNVRWIIIGIIIIIMNEILVNFGIYGDPHLEGNKPVTIRDAGKVITELSGFVGFYLSFFAAIAIAAITYGGYLILTAQFNEEQADKGKGIIMNVLMGIVIVLISYVLVRTVIVLQT